MILEFTEWVIDQAVRAGKQRLYFLARDAYPVYRAAQTLCAARHIDLDCHYLKVSRYALRMAEYRFMGENCVDRLCVGGIRVTLRKILARAGLEDLTESVTKELDMAGEEDTELCYAEIQRLKPKLKTCKHVLEAIKLRSDAAYPAVMDFLRQEGLLDPIPYALVDSGWIGTLQQTMETLLHAENKEIRLEGYYFGLYEIPAGTDPNSYHCYYFSPKKGLTRKANFSNSLFETLCTAPHGMTVGYEYHGDSVIPVEDGASLNQESVERFCAITERLTALYSQEDLCSRQSNSSEKLLRTMMGHPEDWEAEAFGTLQFCDDVLERTVQEAATPLTTDEIRMQRFFSKVLIMVGLKPGKIHESAWIEGSIVRNGADVRQNLFHAKLYKYFVYLRKQLH